MEGETPLVQLVTVQEAVATVESNPTHVVKKDDVTVAMVFSHVVDVDVVIVTVGALTLTVEGAVTAASVRMDVTVVAPLEVGIGVGATLPLPDWVLHCTMVVDE